MKKLVILLPFLVIGYFFMTAQDFPGQVSPRWNDPRTFVPLPDSYIPLPVTDNYVAPFVEKRVYQTDAGTIIVNPSFRVLPNSGVNQTELEIVTSPVNPNIMFGSSNSTRTSGSFISSAVYVSTDGGATWSGSDTLPAPSLGDQRGDPGPTIDKDGRFIFTHLTSAFVFGGVTGMGANFSTDNGATFSSTFQVSSSSSSDKNMAGTDDSPTSPFYGNSYMAWTQFAGVSGNGRFSRTTNGGVSWSTPLVINSTPAGHFAQGHDVEVALNGDVYVCWTAGSSSSPFTEDFVGFAKSTDGGVSFTATENAYDVNGSRSFNFGGWGIRTNGFPRIDVDKTTGSRSGWIYIVSGEINGPSAGTDPDVILHRSTDGGATWSAGIRVNQDPLNNGKVQFFPVVNVDNGGGVNVVYYDNRDFSPTDSCAVYMSRSTDGGNTWSDVKVSSHNFEPKGIGGGSYMGDYIGLTESNGNLFPLWMTDVTGNFQAWTAKIEVGSTPGDSLHDYAAGPFLSLPTDLLAGNSYNIKALISNLGTYNETNAPIKFRISDVQLGTQNLSLNAGASDSVSFLWTPPDSGNYKLSIITALATDTVRSNDTVSQTVHVDLETGIVNIFCDPFNDITNWSITNEGTGCLWQRFSPPFGSSYSLPATSAGNIFGADASLCTGSGEVLSTATLTNSVDCSVYGQVRLEWDNDFRANNAGDTARVEVSYDGGSSWTTVSEWAGTDRRSTHENVALPGADLNPNVKVRFVSIQPGIDWWWVVDNVCIRGSFATGLTNTGGAIPEQYSLLQNYPNPFNPVTRISFGLPAQGNVSLRVFDITGKEVATLVNGVKPAGNYIVDFDGADLSSGIYFYRLQAGEFVQTKRMVLIK